MKLRSKFLLFTLPMILLPLLIASSLSYVYLKGATHRLSIVQLESSLLQLGSDTHARLKLAVSNVSLFANADKLKAYVSLDQLSDSPALAGEVTYALTEFIKAFPNYSEIALFGKDGRLLESVSDVFEQHDFQTRFIRQMIDARLDHHEGVWIPDQDGNIYYLIAHAIKRIDMGNQYIKNRSENIGYLFISVDMRFLHDLIKEGVQKQGIAYFLSNQLGEVVFTPVGANSSVEAESSVVLKKQIKQIISSRSSSINQYNGESGTYYGGYKRLIQDLYLVGMIAESDMVVSSAMFKTYVTWFLVVTMLISYILLRSQINSLITTPIDILRKLLVKFKKGEYDHDVSALGSEELTLLAEDFKDLSKGLSESTETVKTLAYYDSLTGLPNRITFNANLKKALNHCERTQSVLGLLFIDLDNFKTANDVYGHQAGDELLKETATRLESCLRGADVVSRKVETSSEWGNDIVVRLGGDEFTIILTDIEQAHQASMVAQRVVDVLSHPFEIAGAEINIGASIGIAMYPVDGTTADRLIKSADLAMYEAKQKGRNNYKFFTKALNEAVAKRLEIESLLRHAIEHDEFFLVYQPKVRLKDGEVVGFEALVRWNHPEMGVLLPAQFIPVAEDSGMVIDIGRLVIEKVCQQLGLWQNEGLGSTKIAINFSSLHLMQNGILEDIRETFSKHSQSLDNIEIELSEDALIADVNNGVELLNQLNMMGVESALDDFGAGCSSLVFLRKFPVKLIKIDRSYIENIETNLKDRDVLNAMIELAKALSFDVAIEGVETIEQLKIIQKMRCDYVQGFYFSEPVVAEKLQFKYVIPSTRRNHTGS